MNALPHPEQNGRHERMHRTLKEAVLQPPRANHAAQQKAFDAFRQDFNEERPHEALNQHTPASVYAASVRNYPSRLTDDIFRRSQSAATNTSAGNTPWRPRPGSGRVCHMRYFLLILAVIPLLSATGCIFTGGGDRGGNGGHPDDQHHDDHPPGGDHGGPPGDSDHGDNH